MNLTISNSSPVSVVRKASSITAVLTAALVCTSSLRAEPPTTVPTTQAAKPAGTVPQELLGEWFQGTISPTSYWDTQSGKYLGNASSMGSTYRFHPDGTYEEYVYIETRMYNVQTVIWTTYKGTVDFKADTFTVTPTWGHYKTGGTSSQKTDRDMTEEELAKGKKTYNWKLEKNPDTGKTHFVVPFDDGSSFQFRRTESDKAKE
ncbi:MAG TPA: hypothetical protein VGN72_04405 [Tepidisphaeraceae bacterium]|nr:hypothetical protein [Tepidisphaeraceae bacterium]